MYFIKGNMNRTILISLLLVVMSSTCLAQDKCKANNINYDVCKAARTFADEFAKVLPMQMNQNIRLEKSFAIQNVFALQGVYSYTQESLEQELSKNDLTMSEMEEMMRNIVTANVCKAKSPTEAFIKLGGQITHIYNFADYKPYMTIEISKCG